MRASVSAFDFDNILDRIFYRSIAMVVFSCALSLSAFGQTPVLTQHNDASRTGQNTTETILNSSNVNVTQFGKLFALPTTGQIYAQPLYVPGVTINGAIHNVVIVATEADIVYAFDADSNTGANSAPLWKASLVDAAHGAGSGETPLNSGTTVECSDLQPQIGITSTPVIDPVSNTIYVEAKSTNGSSYFHRLHALNLLTGSEKSPGPIQITATVPGTGDGSASGELVFESTSMSLHQQARPGLLLLNSTIYIAFASHCDFGPYHGWVFAYDAATFTRKSVYVTTPNGGDGGFWMSGAGVAADSSGNIYIASGNGDFDTTNVPARETGDTLLKLGTTDQILTLLDYFTPQDQQSLDSNDNDLGAGGVLLLPNQPGTFPHIMIDTGKEGRIYVVNRDQLTTNNSHYCSGCTNDTEIIEESASHAVGGMFSTPAYWNNNIYFWGVGDVLKSIPLKAGLPDFTHISSNSTSISFPGATPSISSNGTAAGTAILWAIDSSQYGSPGPGPGPAVVHAFDATDISTQLWNSTQGTNNRDRAGNAVKFSTPTISNGKVYVGTSSEVDVYGLLPASVATAATPAISPASESVTSAIKVTITDSTPAAEIYYTTDGSTPVPGSHGTAISSGGSFTLTSSSTVKAIASASGFTNSSMTSATYTITTTVPQAASPKISPAAGSYSGSVTVSITDATSGATITYTTDGSTPIPGSHGTAITSGGSFTRTTSATVNAIASASGFSNSSVSTAAYTVTTPPLTANFINFGGGFAGETNLTLNGGATINGTRLRITDGGGTEARSAFNTAPVNITQFATAFSFQLTNPSGDGMTFTIQGVGPTSVGPSGGGLGYGPGAPGGTPGIAKSVAIKFDLYNNAGEGVDSTGWYEDGASPTTPASDMTSSGVNLHSGHVFQVSVSYNGTTLAWTITDATTGKTFSTSATVNIPGTVGGNSAYVGFTGGTGGSTATQEILTWTYTPGSPAAIQYQAASSAVFGASVSSGPTYRVFAWSGFTDGSGTTLDGTAAGQSVTVTLDVPQAGVYDVRFATKKYSTRGIVQLSINGTNVGTAEDEYSSGQVWEEFDLGNVTLAAGNQPFKFTTTGRDASSSGFTQALDYIKLTPQ